MPHFTSTPAIPKKLGKEVSQQLNPNHTVYAVLAMLHIFIQKVSIESQWSHKLQELIHKYPDLNLAAMGFPQDWESGNFWQLRGSNYG